MSVIQEVKNDLAGWKLGRVITVLDRGMASDGNLRYLQRTGGHYIAGERTRAGENPWKRRFPTRAASRPCGTTWRLRRSSPATVRPGPATSWYAIPRRPNGIRPGGKRPSRNSNLSWPGSAN
jgi:hypothetical protein